MKKKSFLIIVLFFMILKTGTFAQVKEQKFNILPYPKQITAGNGKFLVTNEFSVTNTKFGNERINEAVKRFLKDIINTTHVFVKQVSVTNSENKGIVISCNREGALKPNENEAYTIKVTENKIELNAETDLGVLNGLQTILQLIEHDSDNSYIPCCVINDSPRFTWRGLMLDVCRHYLPVEVVKRNIDAMVMAKLNVLHLHLSEDQGFRIECKSFPLLHEKGSDGKYYTQEQIKEIIKYAADRGIRVIPEFDIPGHSTAWFVGYPQYASAQSSYKIETLFGVFDPTFNPTDDNVYKFFEIFFKEMCALFPDEYMHIGGDENNGNQWNNNKDIQKFMKEKKIKDNHELQAYFNIRILKILQTNGKKMIGWDEILQPDLPKDIMIQSWRGVESMVKAAKQGYPSILSNGYYIDLSQTTAFHYLNDPIPNDSLLSVQEQKYILGGEATMWSELVTADNVDSRIWPRTAAIAERFWSPRETKSLANLYGRLLKFTKMVELSGVKPVSGQYSILLRTVNTNNYAAYQSFLEILTPLDGYNRHSLRVYTTFSPFNRIVDIAVPDPLQSAIFNLQLEEKLKTKNTDFKDILNQINIWKNACTVVKTELSENKAMTEIKGLPQKSIDLLMILNQGIEYLTLNKKPDAVWFANAEKIITLATQAEGELKITLTANAQLLINTLKKL